MIFATNADITYYVIAVSTYYWNPPSCFVDTVVGVRTLPRLRTRAIEVDALDPGERKARSGARRHKYRQVARLSERLMAGR